MWGVLIKPDSSSERTTPVARQAAEGGFVTNRGRKLIVLDLVSASLNQASLFSLVFIEYELISIAVVTLAKYPAHAPARH